ncbi:MAG: signal peptidase I [Oscillospiraceae bacterium]|nr:signal peptidase I [Oscillospiraceae bacterium]
MNDFDILNDGVEPDSPGEKSESTSMILHDWLQCIVFAIVLGVSAFIFVGRHMGVIGDSMLPTLFNNDRVIISNLFYSPRNGDVVIFDVVGDTPFVKRVIAVAGQTIDINTATGEVLVDGVAIYEPYISELTARGMAMEGPATVPEGYVFVLGDNRGNSTDSRNVDIGFVDTRYILGRVLFVIFPGHDNTGQRDWRRIGTLRGDIAGSY